MTRHNLNEHLSWLLQAKASVPPNESSFSPVIASFTQVESSQATQDEAQPALQPPTLASAAPLISNALPQSEEDMARLRTAPGSASRLTMVTLGPTWAHTTAASNASPGVSARASATSTHTARPGLKRQNTTNDIKAPFVMPEDVEVMDLTETLSQMGSPAPPAKASRKRKSSEMESEPPAMPCPRHGSRINPPVVETRPGSQHGFIAIDEIMEDQPVDPPPPYSTIPPHNVRRSPRSAHPSSTLAGPPHRDMQDSEDDGDDNIVNLSGSRPPSSLAPPTSKSHSPCRSLNLFGSVATCDAQDKLRLAAAALEESKLQAVAAIEKRDQSFEAGKTTSVTPPITNTPELTSPNSALVKAFFALPAGAIQEAMDRLNDRIGAVCNAIVERLDQDMPSKDLEQQQDDLEHQLEAIRNLSSRRQEYDRLCEEKQSLYNALLSAVKARQGKDQAQAANRAGKEALERFEAECCELFTSCHRELENLVQSIGLSEGDSGFGMVAVHSTQAPETRSMMTAPAAPSSSRIAQTQAPVFQPTTQFNEPLPRQRTTSHDFGPSHIEAYFSPPRNRHADMAMPNGGLRSVGGTNTNDVAFDRGFDDLDDEDLFAATNTMFSNRMGTPPAPFEVDDEEFGMGDDDGMLDFAENIENNGLQPRRTHDVSSRQAFTELPQNSLVKPSNASGKKPKRTPGKADDDPYEDQFRFAWSEDVKETLRERFNLRGFRKNQIEAINATLAGKDVFVLMPTGGGKSLCYQLPALIASGKTCGVTMIVSPLLSLMEDQVQHLRKLNVQAHFINGNTPREEKDAINRGLHERNVEQFVQILYVTPEMLAKNENMIRTMERLYNRQKLARLVIDEAHCVSQWGHDFRPDYKLLGHIRRKFPNVPVMALTATATENVKVDTMHNLGIDGCTVLSSSFNRPNLYYEVRPKGRGKEDIQHMANLIKEKHVKQTGIIYCFSRKNCEDVAKALRDDHKIRAHHYHAGMEANAKSQVQKMWQQGKYHVIVATIAFGMGIDKANVRFVIHHSLPKSLEGYYQETGRAGRDGLKSHCYLFYGYQDATKVRGMIDRDKDSDWRQKERQLLMLRKIVQFCENESDCRRVQVLSYFNENFDPEECKRQCDNCNSTSTFEEQDLTELARQAIALVEQVESQKVTMLHCVDVFRGASTKKAKSLNHHQLKEHGAGSGFDRGDIERLFSRLLREDALWEENVPNKRGFTNQYIMLGKKCRQFDDGRRTLRMQIRSSPRPQKTKPVLKEKSKKAKTAGEDLQQKKKLGTITASDLPMSTNISSPIRGPSKTKKASKQAQQGPVARGYEPDDFVVPDPEDDDDYAETEDDEFSDAFEPVREAGRVAHTKTKALGGPITSDAQMDGLGEVHREVVEEFVERARGKVRDIMIDKSISTAPFSDKMLRRMAAEWTDTEDKMLRIDGMTAEKIQLFGKPFLKLVKDTRRSYEEVLVSTEDRPDPNALNVIDLVSDDEDEDENEYGTFAFEDEEEDGESSAYFQPKAVQDFNARFSYSQADPTLPPQAPSSQANNRRKSGKGKRWKAMGRNEDTGGAGRPLPWKNNGNHAGVTKQRANTKRNVSGGLRKQPSAGRGGGFSMMPT